MNWPGSREHLEKLRIANSETLGAFLPLQAYLVQLNVMVSSKNSARNLEKFMIEVEVEVEALRYHSSEGEIANPPQVGIIHRRSL
jgi:hypothetical protein